MVEESWYLTPPSKEKRTKKESWWNIFMITIYTTDQTFFLLLRKLQIKLSSPFNYATCLIVHSMLHAFIFLKFKTGIFQFIKIQNVCNTRCDINNTTLITYNYSYFWVLVIFIYYNPKDLIMLIYLYNYNTNTQ